MLGLVYAALLALKSTFAVFVALHLLALAVVAALARKAGWKWAMIAGGTAVIWVAPWVALHAPLYLATATSVPPDFPAYAGSPLRELFFTAEVNNYGIAQLQATVVAATIFGLAGAAAFALWRGVGEERRPGLIAVAASGLASSVAYVGLMMVTDRLLVDVSGATRYVTPILLGVLPAQLGLLARDMVWQPRMPVIGAVVALGLLALFWGPLAVRIDQIRTLRTPLAYLSSAGSHPSHTAYNRRVLSGLQDATVREIQQFVPAGEPLAVWIMTPYVLDFARNPIHHADPAGLAMRWARIPTEARYFS